MSFKDILDMLLKSDFKEVMNTQEIPSYPNIAFDVQKS